jgi:acetyl-CoA acyltransferase
MSDDVYVLGIGMTRFAKYPEKGVKQLAADGFEALMQDIPVNMKDIEAAWFSNSAWGMYNFQHAIRGQVALTPLGIQAIPITNVENACAGASTAVQSAWMSVKAGQYDLVLAIGAEKIFLPDDPVLMFKGFMSGVDVEIVDDMISTMKADAEKKARESGAAGKEKQGGHSAFMDIYGMVARQHMEQYGTNQRQLAIIAAKNHHHGSMNPLAQYQKDMTVEEVMEDRVISYPITRSMCAPIGDGAAAALICSERALKRFPDARPVKIRASVLTAGSLSDSGFDPVGVRAARLAYERAGLGPDDIDVAEVHDATAFGELWQYENMGFCGEGEGGPFAESGATALGGKLPVNTSGGLECRGHPIGASGIAQMFELVTQLRGDAGPRQVEGARIALAENGGGFIGMGEAAMCVHILEKV